MSHALDYTVVTNKTFAEAVRAVEQKAVENGFRVLHVHDFAAILGEKGFAREPLTIVEICNARYASEVLKKDVRTALLLPCPVAVFVENEKTCISTMLPSTMADFFPEKGIAEVAFAVEETVRKIVDEAKAESHELVSRAKSAS